LDQSVEILVVGLFSLVTENSGDLSEDKVVYLVLIRPELPEKILGRHVSVAFLGQLLVF
jgi:hypothetical protein